MSVVKLKLITVTGGEESFNDALSACRAEESFRFINAADTLENGRKFLSNAASGQNIYAQLGQRLAALAAAVGINHDLNDPAGAGVIESNAEISDTLDGWERRLDDFKSREATLLGSINDNKRILEQLGHLRDVDVSIDVLFNAEYLKFRFGHMPRYCYDNLSHYSRELDEMFFFPSHTSHDEVWGIYMTPLTKAARIDALFNTLHFERVHLSDRIRGKPAESAALIESEIERLTAELNDLRGAMGEFAAEIAPVLQACSARITEYGNDFEYRRLACLHDGVFYITGWIPAAEAGRIESELSAMDGVSCTVDAPAPNSPVVPPTILKNNILTRPFEQFVNMYGRPSYFELDPTPIVALTYTLFFGMMFGDVGQGIVLFLAGILMWRYKNFNLGRIISLVGVSSTAFGFFYGSIFGIEDIIHGFNPSHNINTVLFAAVGLGAVMLCAAMTLNIINAVRTHDAKKLLLSHNGIAGLILYIAIIVLVVTKLGFGGISVSPVILSFIIAAGLLVLFFEEPLSKMLAKRTGTPYGGESHNNAVESAAGKSGNGRGRGSALDFVLENLFGLLEVILSFLTNTISFIRIGAFALSHAGMMTVVFLLARTASGGYNPVVLLVGNLFVIGFEGMIVGIQALRLEFYELFGRFYDGSGQEDS